MTRLRTACSLWCGVRYAAPALPFLCSTWAAFAALKSGGRVVTFGDPEFGGNSSAVAGLLNANVVAVFSTNSAFAALLANGTAVVWGDPSCGGDASAVAGFLASGVASISATACAFAALSTTGAVASWGDAAFGGDSSAVAASLGSGVQAVYGSQVEGVNVVAGAFVALLPTRAVCWGAAAAGGNCSGVSKQVVNISAVYSNTAGFAAVTNKGVVVSWGSYNIAAGTAGATRVYSTATAWAVLKNTTAQGLVYTYGNPEEGGSTSLDADLTAKLTKAPGVRAVYSNQAAFVAISRSDGSLLAVSWQGARACSAAAAAGVPLARPLLLPPTPPPPTLPLPNLPTPVGQVRKWRINHLPGRWSHRRGLRDQHPVRVCCAAQQRLSVRMGGRKVWWRRHGRGGSAGCRGLCKPAGLRLRLCCAAR